MTVRRIDNDDNAVCVFLSTAAEPRLNSDLHEQALKH